MRPRLFQPVKVATGVGRGIGLAIWAKIPHQHQGHIEVQSQAGIGTSAPTYPPRAPATENLMNPAPTPAAASETILFVEDDVAIRSIIRQVLLANGFVLLEAGGGAEALALAEQFRNPIQLLLSDLSMPQMNGMELAERLAPLHPETKVLFLSGYEGGILPGDVAPPEDIPFLQKPFKNEVLLQKIRAILHPPKG
jgi:two-component system cell cycle sensor histidine kinase/response regulator CckA